MTVVKVIHVIWWSLHCRYDKLKVDHDDLEKKHQQMLEEKVALADQLQAEVELCNEAEEVIVSLVLYSALKGRFSFSLTPSYLLCRFLELWMIHVVIACLQ